MTKDKVALLGSGTMGGGIAISALIAGYKTAVYDLNAESLTRFLQRLEAYLGSGIAKGKLTSAEAEAIRARLSYGTNLDLLRGAGAIIEAVFEELAVKRDLLTRIAPYVGADTIVATNTSALRVSDMADCLPRPEAFVGLHFFSPAEVNPLVEIVRGDATAETTVDRAQNFTGSIGKTPIVSADRPGFVVNRFFCPLMNEATRLLEDGVGSITSIDACAKDIFAAPMGPFEVMNIVKPVIALNAIQNLSVLGPFYAPTDLMQCAGAANEPWELSEPRPQTFDTDAIKERLLAAVVFPVLEAVAEGVAPPNSFDLGAALALRFGKPPVEIIRNLGRNRIAQLIDGSGVPGMRLPKAALNEIFAAPLHPATGTDRAPMAAGAGA